MAKMIDLDAFSELSYDSNFRTRSLNISEFMESIFVLSLSILSILYLQDLMKIGSVSILFPTLIIL